MSSTFRDRGRVECAYNSCFNKVPVDFWLNCKLRRKQEIAAEIMLMNRDELAVLPNEFNITNVLDSKWATKKHEGLCPFYISILKDQIAKARSVGIKCVCLLGINFHGFSLAKLY